MVLLLIGIENDGYVVCDVEALVEHKSGAQRRTLVQGKTTAVSKGKGTVEISKTSNDIQVLSNRFNKMHLFNNSSNRESVLFKVY